MNKLILISALILALAGCEGMPMGDDYGDHESGYRNFEGMGFGGMGFGGFGFGGMDDGGFGGFGDGGFGGMGDDD
ncbi:hypothetical protein GALL_184300 [mine drainage metagenome]|uniref:Lipoprotein n=1 Tax=mine drainage metagenome TaxID=410659 RepID=A0A1J5SH56_9ZZZZ